MGLLSLVVAAAVGVALGLYAAHRGAPPREGYAGMNYTPRGDAYRKVDSLAAVPNYNYRSALLYRSSPGCAYGSDEGKVCTNGTDCHGAPVAGTCYRGLCMTDVPAAPIASYYSRFLAGAAGAETGTFGAPCT